MLQQPTKEKLYALRLHGMIEAIERQEQDEEAREAQLPRSPGAADRSAVALAREPGVDATSKSFALAGRCAWRTSTIAWNGG